MKYVAFPPPGTRWAAGAFMRHSRVDHGWMRVRRDKYRRENRYGSRL